MPDIPAFISYTFIAITIAVLSFMVAAVDQATPKRSNFSPTIVGTILIVWLFLTALGSFYEFFLDYEAFPPRLLLVFVVTIGSMIWLLTARFSRDVIDKMSITTLTYVHIIRVPVELVLWWLANEGMVDRKLTFEGSNFDILMGVTAPFAAIFLVGSRSKSKFAAIAWNIIGIVMLANIVIMAVRATPYFFDSAVFDQPNIAVFYFPFIWLPAFVVPAVLFSHVASLYLLFRMKEETY